MGKIPLITWLVPRNRTSTSVFSAKKGSVLKSLSVRFVTLAKKKMPARTREAVNRILTARTMIFRFILLPPRTESR